MSTIIDLDKIISIAEKRFDTPLISNGITINSSTSTTISAANASRLFFIVSNDDNAIGFWLKEQPASTDNDKKGIFVSGKTGANPFYEMKKEKYVGEISAIAVSGSFEVYVTEK